MPAGGSGWGVAHLAETLAKSSSGLVWSASTAPVGGVEGRPAGLVVVSGTLLGPEKTSVSPLVRGGLVFSGGIHILVLGRSSGRGAVVGLPAWGGCGCVLVECCIVDASIFVVKLLRAHGGCLGTRSR